MTSRGVYGQVLEYNPERRPWFWGPPPLLLYLIVSMSLGAMALV